MRAKLVGLVAASCAVAVFGGAAPDEPRSVNQQRGKNVGHDTTLSGPFTHQNLSIFLIHGKDQIKDRLFLTLPEALKSKKAIIHETEQVEELAVENLSNEDLLIQAGDIVKGGQQDRILAVDLIVPAMKDNKPNKLPISSFCCEAGRWSRRGHEDANRFSSGDAQIPTGDLKIAVRKEKSQESVWKNVAKTQMRLGSGLGGTGGAFARPTVGVEGQLGGPLTDPSSPTSLQLALESAVLKMAANTYHHKLKSAPAGKNDVIGCVVAVNGKITGGEVYGSNAMFRKLWPRLLEASTVEAIAARDTNKKSEETSVEAVRTFLRDVDAGERTSTDVTKRVGLVQCESEKGISFETRDREHSDVMIRRSYIAKPGTRKGE